MKRALARLLRRTIRILRRAADRLDPHGRLASGGFVILADRALLEPGPPGFVVPSRPADSKAAMRAIIHREALSRDAVAKALKDVRLF